MWVKTLLHKHSKPMTALCWRIEVTGNRYAIKSDTPGLISVLCVAPSVLLHSDASVGATSTYVELMSVFDEFPSQIS